MEPAPLTPASLQHHTNMLRHNMLPSRRLKEQSTGRRSTSRKLYHTNTWLDYHCNGEHGEEDWPQALLFQATEDPSIAMLLRNDLGLSPVFASKLLMRLRQCRGDLPPSTTTAIGTNAASSEASAGLQTSMPPTTSEASAGPHEPTLAPAPTLAPIPAPAYDTGR